MAITTFKYTLRGGQVQPRFNNSGCQTAGTPSFYAQTFGVEKIQTDSFDAKTKLLASSDMRGQKPLQQGQSADDPNYVATTYTRASYQGKAYRNTDGELVFSGTEEHVGVFVDESELGL